MVAPAKFVDPERTADGRRRAQVDLVGLETLWFNTGTLCNLTCENCYIESSPRNDRLVYLSAPEVAGYLDEVESARMGTRQIGFTGGEPFMNPDLPTMLADALGRGYTCLVLTNAMRPMTKRSRELSDLRRQYGSRLEIRVSVDHYTPELHERERGARTWKPMLAGLKWLSGSGFHVSAAGRTYWGESEPALRAGYRALFAREGIAIDASHPARLVLFPEMDETEDVPEITTECWKLVGRDPGEMMCATSRMVVKRKGEDHPVVVACTLLPYDSRFELGDTLTGARRSVKLNHPHCAKFCVLGGGSCSLDD